MLKIKLILIISILLLSLSGCSPEETNEALQTRYEYEYLQSGSGKTTMSGEEYARIMQERRAKRIQVSKSGKEGW